MVKRVIAYILFAIGFVIIAFFRNYHGTIIPYPFVIWLIGLSMWFFGWRVLRYGEKFKQLREDEKQKKFIDDLKENGEKIQVDLTQCEIKENDYSEMRLPDGRREADLSDFEAESYSESSGEKLTEIDQTVFIFKHLHNGIEEKFYSPVIPRTGDDLKIKLYLHKTTTLYVDKTDRSKYFFDLDFLNHPE